MKGNMKKHFRLFLLIYSVLIFTACGNGSSPAANDDGIDRITIIAPAKTGYYKNSSFSSAGLEVTGYYKDGSTVIVKSGYKLLWNNQTINDGNSVITAATGDKKVTVSWRNKTANFTITVSDTNSLEVKTTEQWINALSFIRDGGDSQGYTITITGDIGIPGSYDQSFGGVSDLTVTLNGNGRLYLTGQGNLIQIGGGQTLYIDSADLTLEGLTSGKNESTQDNNGPVIAIYRGAGELRSGCIIGNTNTGVYGGGILVNAGNFLMTGGIISGNNSQIGGGVCVWDGSFNKTDGIIYGSDAVDVNKNFANLGSAVFFNVGVSQRNITLYETDNLSTDDLDHGWGQ